MTALQTEQHLHTLLHREVVMKDEVSGRKLGKWYYEIKEILTAVETTWKEQIAIVQNLENISIISVRE